MNYRGDTQEALQILQSKVLGSSGSAIDSHRIIDYLTLLLKNIEQSNTPVDWTITHGDAHVGNLFYEYPASNKYIDPLQLTTMIDFDTMKETYGPIGDRPEDVGRLLGSLWEEGAIYCANQLNNQHGGLFEEEFKEKILNTYNKISMWQNIFIDAYLRETIQLKIKSANSDEKPDPKADEAIQIIFNHVTLAHSNLKDFIYLCCTNHTTYYYCKFLVTSLGAVLSLNLYKLSLYKTIFTNAKATPHTKQFLLYFFLREANIISK